MTPQTETLAPLSVQDAAHFARMPAHYQDLVLHQLTQHAEGELMGAEDYLAHFYPLAPDAFEKKVCCERAAEELDHFMRAANVLAEINVDVSHMLSRSISQRQHYKTEGMERVDTWLKRGLFSFLGEAAVLSILKEMASSSYRPVADMTRQVIIDEYVHVVHGQRIVEQFIASDGAAGVQPDFEVAWAMSLDLFGKSDSQRSLAYVRWGLRQHSNQRARELYVQEMTPTLNRLGLVIPSDNRYRKFL